MSERPAAYDDLQPLSATQIAQVRDYVEKLEQNNLPMWDIPIGTELEWDMEITPESVILHADGVEDFNPWYEAWPVGPGESPFGTAIAPAMLVPYGQHWFHREGMGVSEVGGMGTQWKTEFFAPVMVGSTVRYHGKLTRKFIKRGRQYTQREFTVTDAETGKLLVKHTAIALSQYEKVDLPDGDVEEQGNGSGN
jgi:acyl dehydratase